ncbi:GNAT family N-acetyltransferase [Paracoccus tegillarcae]|nr:GNAT family N-acetyltransferase [Paracoccus tegillarcae]
MAKYGFRPVTRDDFPMLAGWLRQPAVAEWWKDTDQQIASLGEALDDPAMHLLIVLRENQPVAYVQHSVAAHWNEPHYDAAGTPDGTIAVDVFSGPDGMGHGGEWLNAVAEHLLERAPALIIDPDPANLRAIRAYEKAGFQGTRVVPNEDGEPARIMTRHR